MFKNFILICLLAGAALTCLAAASVSLLFRGLLTSEPPALARVASGITDSFVLPIGYEPKFAASLAGYSLWSASSPAGNAHIFLAQIPERALVGLSAVEDLGHQTGQRISNRAGQLQPYQQVEIVIQGQTQTVQVQTGLSGEGRPFLSMSAFFQGKGGPALVTVSAPVQEWDQAAFTKFMASIR